MRSGFSGAHRILAATAASSGVVIALAAAPGAAADGWPLPSNCLPGTYGQMVYCDGDVQPDGNWVRCAQAAPQPLFSAFGAPTGDTVPGGAPDCNLVKPNALPAGSPPYHIGYGGEATGRV